MITINGSFEVDLEKGIVKNTETNYIVSLGVNEIELLNYFIDNSNTLLSKKDLLDHVWTRKGVFVEESSLMNALSYCRKAFDDKYGKVIKTERGKGYRFVGEIDSAQPEQVIEQECLKPIEKDTSSFVGKLNVRWTIFYIALSGVCFSAGMYASATLKGFKGPDAAKDYSYRVYDSCAYISKSSGNRKDFGRSAVITNDGISIIINEQLESLSFPSNIAEVICE
ncbi:winged helix-turn-helix domain-containing protein [Vibrio coralliilyticus]|uniref:winged helix-turn-helix domain-containing protein n=1 Tax=Vibrio coralliilyticus TaxID=190893 RepID=UPI00181DF46A|nr:winged helix-turn-helix domain-containing protein [Vibrio coralliilyticus]NUW70043.1 winged helix-turn-helix domain-containing protein [Vibrio coralliilyticus]